MRQICNPNDNTTLVLSYRWLPINIIPAKDAFRKFLSTATYSSPIYSIGPDGEMYNWNDWLDESVCNYHHSQPYMRTPDTILPVPTILLTTSTWEYKTPIRSSIRYLYSRFRGICQICGQSKSAREMTLEHVIPKSKYGPDDSYNITMTCGKCNNIKGTSTPYKDYKGDTLQAPSPIPFFHTFNHTREEWQNYLFKIPIS